MPRTWPLPYSGTTIHLLGDLHIGMNTTLPRRLEVVRRDLAVVGNVPIPAARIQVGDQTENAAASEWATWLDFKAQLIAVDAAPLLGISGNHDHYNNGTTGTRAQWSASSGFPEYTVQDIGGVRVLAFSNPDFNETLTQTELDWLDAQLTAAGSRPVVVTTHYPLMGTVDGPTTGNSAVFSSNESGFHVVTTVSGGDTALRNVLATHSNVAAYVCGHTHTPITGTGLVTPVTLGGNTFAHINASAIAYVARTSEQADPIRSVYLTVSDDAHTIDVRARDHGKRAWSHFRPGTQVLTVTR